MIGLDRERRKREARCRVPDSNLINLLGAGSIIKKTPILKTPRTRCRKLGIVKMKSNRFWPIDPLKFTKTFTYIWTRIERKNFLRKVFLAVNHIRPKKGSGIFYSTNTEVEHLVSFQVHNA